MCSALAAVAHAMKAGEDLAKSAVTEGVTAALTACGMPRLPARLAGRAAADKLISLMTAGHWEAVRRAVQLQAVAACPDVTEHPRSRTTVCGHSRRTYCRLRFRRSWRSHCQAIVHCRRARPADRCRPLLAYAEA